MLALKTQSAVNNERLYFEKTIYVTKIIAKKVDVAPEHLKKPNPLTIILSSVVNHW